MRTLLSTLALAALLSAAPAQAARPAEAAARAPVGYEELTFWGILGAGYGYHDGYESGFGVGGRYRMALVPEGFIRPNASRIRDSFDLEFGADLTWYTYYVPAPVNDRYTWTAFRPRAGVMWDVWFTPQLAIYPKIDLGYQFGWFSGYPGGSHPSWSGIFMEPSIGLIWRFRPATSLRVEAGSEGLKLGVGLAF